MHANRMPRARLIARVIDIWCIPVFIGMAIGIVIGSVLSFWHFGEILELIDQGFADALDRVVLACGVTE